MSYQTCPLCKGSGLNTTPGTYTSIQECPVCEGKRIINEISGLPPSSKNLSSK